MSTIGTFKREAVQKENHFFSEVRSILETAFYSNTVTRIDSLKEAYKLATDAPGTIVTDMEIYQPELIGLPEQAKIIVVNDGSVHGRCAAARQIYDSQEDVAVHYQDLLKEAVFDLQKKALYTAECVVGLDSEFMVKARLLVPSEYRSTAYNWLLNFQEISREYEEVYMKSQMLQEGDILIMTDPDWKHPNHPYGLSLFDVENNCAAILGMRYFGEFKKGTLTMAWNIANRNGYVACHGGLKKYMLKDGSSHVMAIFGLSGSGKSTLTHARHEDKYRVSVLHDDAFIISVEEGNSIALEPSYFDKTADYPLISDDNKYLLSVQNCGVTCDESGKKVIVCEDIRNANGRAIKSKLWTKNRVDKVEESINSIVWLMKDETLPPVVKIEDPVLASAMGALLATKRTSAERTLENMDVNQLVIEPYANPFRTYKLEEDYRKFKKLFEEKQVDCYIFNTGFFMGKKVTKEMTIESIERVVQGRDDFIEWNGMEGFSYMDIEGFNPNMKDWNYVIQLGAAFEKRLDYIIENGGQGNDFNSLPEEVAEVISGIIAKLTP